MNINPSQKLYIYSQNEMQDITKVTLRELPEEEEDVSVAFKALMPEQISHEIVSHLVEAYPIHDSIDGINHFAPLLKQLDKLKNRLGGSPNFGAKHPNFKNTDSKLYFGIPLSAIKDWFRMTLIKKWKPQFFWKAVARLFNVRENNLMSQYEQAYISIQQFGLLISNKERFFQILKRQEKERYSEFSVMTGLAWHPNSNGAEIEKMYIEFIEQFLTVYFDSAKQQGDDALVDYFNAFSGVCFEDKARELESYITVHPINSQIIFPINIPADWDTGSPVEAAYMKEAQVLALQLGDTPTPIQLFEHLTKKEVFDLEFTNIEGVKVKPSQKQFDKWAKEQVDLCILQE